MADKRELSQEELEHPSGRSESDPGEACRGNACGLRKLSRGALLGDGCLQSWIASDPRVLEDGLNIFGEDVDVDGVKLDLLALDQDNRWVAIVVTQGLVKRETLTRALDCASYLATARHDRLPEVVREHLVAHDLLADPQAGAPGGQPPLPVRMVIAGTGRHRSVDRWMALLAGSYCIPISVVVLDVYELSGCEWLVLRSFTASMDQPGPADPGDLENLADDWTADRVFAQADRAGVGTGIRSIYRAAARHGLEVVAYDRCLAYGVDGGHALFYTVVPRERPAANFILSVKSERFEMHFDVDAGFVRRLLGRGRRLRREDVQGFVDGLDRLFALLEADGRG